MNREEAIAFRDQLREARAQALRDAEGFQQILFAIERLGCRLLNSAENLGTYQAKLEELAGQSPHFKSIPESARSMHMPFDVLFPLVKDARNDALHQGARVRHLTRNAISLSLILEDALMTYTDGTAADYMVRNPICAELWQPISFVRLAMLENSFSFLPINVSDKNDLPNWRLVPDFALASYLSAAPSKAKRNNRLGQTLEQARAEGLIQLECARIVAPSTKPQEALQDSNGRPVLVIDDKHPDRLLGILTPFDLL